MLMSSVAPEATMMNARCTTTSAPLTSRSTVARSRTSPCTYSVLRQPREAGSNGRRAMPTMRATSLERSSASMNGLPISPVGPVTATVRPCLRAVVRRAGGTGPRRLPGLAPGDLALADLAHALDLLGVGLVALDGTRRQLEAADDLARPQQPVAVGVLGQLTADLEVALPLELLAVIVGREAGLAGAQRRADRVDLDVHDALRRVGADRHADREREPVRPDDGEDCGVVLGAELIHPRVPDARRVAGARRAGVLRLLVVARADLVEMRVEQLRLGGCIAARPHIDPLRPDMDVQAFEVPLHEPAAP